MTSIAGFTCINKTGVVLLQQVVILTKAVMVNYPISPTNLRVLVFLVIHKGQILTYFIMLLVIFHYALHYNRPETVCTQVAVSSKCQAAGASNSFALLHTILLPTTVWQR